MAISTDLGENMDNLDNAERELKIQIQAKIAPVHQRKAAAE